jgi:MFS family permease
MNNNYFNLEKDKATAAQNLELVISNVPSILMLILSGYIYDIIGRRKTLFASFFFGGVCLFLFPLSKPYIWLYVVSGCLFNIGTASL